MSEIQKNDLYRRELSVFTELYRLYKHCQVDPSGGGNMDFNERIQKAIKESIEKCNYTPHLFIQMVNEHGAVETAKKLINSSKPSDGYVKLYEKSRLDLTVENIVLEEEWADLFTPEELNKARKRLKDFNFIPASTKTDTRWSFDELKACVDAYLEMLNKQQNSIEFNKSRYNEQLREGI